MGKILLLLTLITTVSVLAEAVVVSDQESTLQKVDFRHCGKNANQCLKISAPSCELSHIQNTIHCKNAQIEGLGFDKKEISSVIIDLGQGQLLLRERRHHIYLGEWSVNLDTLEKSFYATPQ